MLLPLFTHDPLPESTPHIRLLQLVQGDFDQDIICNLSIWPLDTAPSYIAISYTWGDPTPTVNITVNNRRMVGRQNCQYALQQAFNQTRSRQQYLWLDAICIDQNNNWEKGHQVALMGELYKRAAQVFACVGPHENRSEELVSFYRKKLRLLDNTYRKIQAYTGPMEGTWYPQNVVFFDRLFVLRTKLKHILEDWDGPQQLLFTIFRQFVDRPYFKRVWILQELYMGHDVFFCCGPDLLQANRVLALSQILAPLLRSQSFRHTVLRLPKIICVPHGSLLYSYSNLYGVGCLALAAEVQRPRSLIDTFKALAYFQCADLRDKLYGVLAVIDWPARSRPVPDYTKDILEIAAEVLVLLTSEHKARGQRDVDPIGLVIDAFDLDCKHPDMRDTLEAWSRAAADTVLSACAENDFLLLPGDFRGIEIHSGSLPVQPHTVLYRLEPIANATSVTLVNEFADPIAKAPLSTKPGDWYLYTDTVGLIIRPSQTPRYTIFGFASPMEPYADLFGRGERFDTFWSPRDAIMYYMYCMHAWQIDYGEPLCECPGSAYALKHKEKQFNGI